ncbi:MAG: TRAP transporter large permease [Betaproteobacteria bacterium]|nr:MAG: TRAP transporter large permease [Betaproteobacteria bacterium]
MSELAAAGIGFLLMLGGLALGLHVAVALFFVSALGAWAYLGWPALMGFGDSNWSALNDFIITAIPLFVLMGELLLHSGVTEKMYRSLSDWLAHLPGGLLHSNIAASAAFAAISGSSVATAATIGTVALPAMAKRNYDERWVVGSIAAGGTLGILIPPSINMIIYGAITNTSIGRLFMAGVVPGLLLTALFMAIIIVASVLKPAIAGHRDAREAPGVRLRRLGELLPPVLVFAIVMGSIYLGWATATEAAALGVLASLALAAFTGHLSLKMLHECFLATARTTAMILLIVSSAFFLAFVIGTLGIPQALTQFVADAGTGAYATIWILVFFYLVLGCFLETLSMMISTIPVVVPLVVSLGFDPVWFGIFLVLMCELSLVTPPVGMNLYVVQAVRRHGSITDVIAGSLPFIVMMIAMTALLIYFPQFALWLPARMFSAAS